VDPATFVTLTFSEWIRPNVGYITLTNVSDGTVYNYTVQHPLVSIVGNVLTLRAGLTALASYRVFVSPGIVTTFAGLPYVGVTGLWRFFTVGRARALATAKCERCLPQASASPSSLPPTPLLVPPARP
jgi:hypothetical protein